MVGLADGVRVGSGVLDATGVAGEPGEAREPAIGTRTSTPNSTSPVAPTALPGPGRPREPRVLLPPVTNLTRFTAPPHRARRTPRAMLVISAGP